MGAKLVMAKMMAISPKSSGASSRARMIVEAICRKDWIPREMVETNPPEKTCFLNSGEFSLLSKSLFTKGKKYKAFALEALGKDYSRAVFEVDLNSLLIFLRSPPLAIAPADMKALLNALVQAVYGGRYKTSCPE